MKKYAFKELKIINNAAKYNGIFHVSLKNFFPWHFIDISKAIRYEKAEIGNAQGSKKVPK